MKSINQNLSVSFSASFSRHCFQKPMSCLNPVPYSGNCPSPLSWPACAYSSDTLVFAGICQWGRRAESYTRMHPITDRHTRTRCEEHSRTSARTKVDCSTHTCRKKCFFVMLFVVSKSACVREQKRQGLLVPEAAMSGSIGVDSECAH